MPRICHLVVSGAESPRAGAQEGPARSSCGRVRHFAGDRDRRHCLRSARIARQNRAPLALAVADSSRLSLADRSAAWSPELAPSRPLGTLQRRVVRKQKGPPRIAVASGSPSRTRTDNPLVNSQVLPRELGPAGCPTATQLLRYFQHSMDSMDSMDKSSP